MIMAVEKGTVKWFNGDKGFGFIVREQGADLLVHQSDLVEGTTLKENQRVEFGVAHGQAINVTVVDA